VTANNLATRADDRRLGPQIPDKACLKCGRVGSREFVRVAPDVHRCTSFRSCIERSYQNMHGKRRDRTWRPPMGEA
jgi:hypothetical protein